MTEKINDTGMALFTISDIKEKLNHLLSLDRVNPGDGCVYTNIDGEHCIAGQLLADMELDVPSYDSEYTSNNFTELPQAELFTPQVVELIQDIQWEACAWRPWNEIKGLIDCKELDDT